MIPILGPIVTGLFSLGKSYMDERKEVKAAEHQRTLKHITGEQEWDTLQAKNSGDSWKDEYLTLIFTSPFVILFVGVLFDVPELIVRMKEAFIVIDTEVPTEYWYLLSVIVAASFGVKSVIKGIQKIRGGK